MKMDDLADRQGGQQIFGNEMRNWVCGGVRGGVSDSRLASRAFYCCLWTATNGVFPALCLSKWIFFFGGWWRISKSLDFLLRNCVVFFLLVMITVLMYIVMMMVMVIVVVVIANSGRRRKRHSEFGKYSAQDKSSSSSCSSSNSSSSSGGGGSGGFFLACGDFGRMLDHLFPVCAFFFFFFLKWRLTCAHKLNSSCQNQSTVAQRGETTVAKCSLTNCV